MATILIVYSTKEGHTEKIVERMRETLAATTTTCARHACSGTRSRSAWTSTPSSSAGRSTNASTPTSSSSSPGATASGSGRSRPGFHGLPERRRVDARVAGCDRGLPQRLRCRERLAAGGRRRLCGLARLDALRLLHDPRHAPHRPPSGHAGALRPYTRLRLHRLRRGAGLCREDREPRKDRGPGKDMTSVRLTGSRSR
jgi:hypothetical protein